MVSVGPIFLIWTSADSFYLIDINMYNLTIRRTIGSKDLANFILNLRNIYLPICVCVWENFLRA